MANLAIRGHATRSKEVIEILKMLGGNNYSSGVLGKAKFYYYIGNYNSISYISKEKLNDSFITFTLEKFLEQFPYKVGDRVRIPEYESEVRISKMYWDGNEVQYEVVTDEVEWYSAKELNEFNEPNKEETMEEIKIDIPKGYEFAGVDDDNQQVVFEKIGYQYPKTYDECGDMLNADEFVEYELMTNFPKLINARNAYWKIAGDWKEKRKGKAMHYVIYSTLLGEIVKDAMPNCIANYLLDFPTEEMRDAFYENFKDLIIECIELL